MAAEEETKTTSSAASEEASIDERDLNLPDDAAREICCLQCVSTSLNSILLLFPSQAIFFEVMKPLLARVRKAARAGDYEGMFGDLFAATTTGCHWINDNECWMENAFPKFFAGASCIASISVSALPPLTTFLLLAASSTLVLVARTMISEPFFCLARCFFV